MSFSEETDERTFEYKGAALRHAERMYEENPDESMILIIVDNKMNLMVRYLVY